MEGVLWFLGGLLHSLLHPDSSFYTLREGGFGHVGTTTVIILSNAIWATVLYQFNRVGFSLSARHWKSLTEKIQYWSSVSVGKLGYGGLALLCVIPYVPWLRESALVTGQLLELKYTLLVVVVFNTIRVITLSILFF